MQLQRLTLQRVHEHAYAIMGGSKRSLLALRHALQLFKACLNKWHRGWDKITVLHAGCALHQGVLYHVKQ